MDCDESDRRITQVLVIYEDQQAIMSLCGALFSYGYGTHAAESKEAALQVLQKHAIDLVFCEFNVAGGCGMEFTNRLYRIFPKIPVVLVGNLEDVDQIGFETGASDFLVKPFNPATLPFIIENSLQRKRIEARRLVDQRSYSQIEANDSSRAA